MSHLAQEVSNGPRLASYAVYTHPKPLGQQLRKLRAFFNDYHQAVRDNDAETMDRLDELVPPLLDEFERGESWEDENPQWRRRSTRAGWHVARGDFELALEYEMEGWHYANVETEKTANNKWTDIQKSVSASNISDILRRLGRYEEAIHWGKVSVDLWGTNTINHLVLALALYR